MMYRDFMDAGFRIFGLRGAKDGVCGCGNPECKALFKHPVASNWQHTPMWSDEQLEVMELTGQLATGYGVLVSGLLVVDIDARNGGVASYEKLLEKVPSIAGAGLIVETGSGGGSKHLYFSLPEQQALIQHSDDYPGIDFKSSGFVVGPGSMHASGRRYEAVSGSPFEIGQAPAELIDMLKKPERHRANIDGHQVDVSHKDLAEMAAHIDPDCDHDTWVRVGMALHHASQGTAFEVWDEWSAKGQKYPGPAILEKRWHSFGKAANPVTLATLVRFAEDAGWQSPVTFTPDIEFDYEESSAGPTLDTKGVDLLRPPGFVGKICDWINDQCRFPREQLAVAASLVAVGNVVGLRYTDDLDGVTSNQFAFCVAGSGTGKEAIQQAIAEIHRAAGIHRATHGAIKSEQEITRNLIRHQAALYIIDEIGIFLQKIANAQKRGGAAYLDGVIGLMMSAYSKADGFMLLTGDTKDDVRAMMQQELAACIKAINNNEDENGYHARRKPQLERALEHIDNGLERPFVSMVGFTTPVTFEGLVTHEQATNGFIGRSLLIRERETNPKAKRRFKKRPMPDEIKYALAGLYSGGSYDAQADGGRVEYYGDRIRIPTDPDAADLMAEAQEWFYQYAEDHKGKTGLEAVVRRGYEIMAKISLTLAAPEGLRTVEHVRWAYAMAKRDIDDKIALAHGNETDSEAEAIAARIMSVVSKEHGEPISVVRQRCRKWDRKKVDETIAKLVEKGYLEEVDVPVSGGSKKTTKRYFSTA